MLTIDEIKKAAEKYGRKYGVDRIYLFGSYARGEATSKSDVDFRVDDGGKITSLFQLGGLSSDLEKELGTSIDIAMTDDLSSIFLKFIKQDEILLYERA